MPALCSPGSFISRTARAATQVDAVKDYVRAGRALGGSGLGVVWPWALAVCVMDHWVIVGVGDEDGDVSRRDKVGATGALPKQIEGLGCRVGLYRCALHIAEAVTETIA